MHKTCPYCGTELTEDASGETPVICPTCGHDENEAADGPTQPTPQETHEKPGSSVPREAPEPVLTEDSPAWERPGHIFDRLWLTTWQVLLHPVRTFSAPGRSELKWPLGYAVIMGTFSAVGSYFLNDYLLGIKRAGSDPTTQQILFWTTVVSPIIAPLFILLIAGFTQLGLAIASRQRKGYKTTLRCVCYLTATGLSALVPYVGTIMGFVWGAVVSVLALSAAHKISRIRAIIAVVLSHLIPWLPFFFLWLILTLLLMASR